MKLTIEYFAILKEQRGCSTESVETPANNLAELYEELKARHGFSLDQLALKVAVNEDFAGWDQPLEDGDTVVFIPPVAGG
jgi:molybdopterin synthase sulfur carrier subunit